MPPPGALVFDLDDTLYLERDFAMSGYRTLGRWVRDTMGIDGFDTVCARLFEAGERRHVFDRALAELGVTADPTILRDLIERYRGHRPEISLAPDAARYLTRAQDAVPLGLITDGPAATQWAKIRALGLDDVIDRIVVTGDWPPGFGKPHPRAFERQERWQDGRPGRMIYVADNPLKDFVTPRARGWLTIQIARPGRVHLAPAPDPRYQPHAEITSLDQLDDVLGTNGISLSEPRATP